MFSQLTYKQKFYGLLAVSLLLGLAVYKKTFKHVFEIKTELSYFPYQYQLKAHPKIYHVLRYMIDRTKFAEYSFLAN